MILSNLMVMASLMASEPTGEPSDVASYYRRMGHPQSAAFYDRLAAKKTEARVAQQMADFYQRMGYRKSAELYRRIAARRLAGQ